MPSSWFIISTVLPIFTVIGIGLLFRHLRILSEEADRSIFRLIINLLTPCLVFDSILGNKALENPSTPILAPLLGLGTVAVGLYLSLVCAKYAGLKDDREMRSFALAVGIYNWGYLALPVIDNLFGRETMGVLFVFNLGVEGTMWTLGLAIMTGGSLAKGWKHIFNPPVFSIIAALLLNYLGARDWLPKFVLYTIHLIAPCAIPVGLLLIGASFYDQLGSLRWGSAWRVGSAACLLRLLILPVLFLLALWIIPLPRPLQEILLVQAAMPSAVFPLVLTRHYGGDPATAFRVILATSLVSFLTMPIWIQLGLKIIQP